MYKIQKTRRQTIAFLILICQLCWQNVKPTVEIGRCRSEGL